MGKKLLTVIDIGSSKISTVISNIEEENKVSVIGVAVYPTKGIKKGVVINIDDATDAISESLEAAERMAGVTVSSAIISIGGKHITSVNNKGIIAVSKDEITSEDVARAIESARTVAVPPTREILHVIPREFIIDSQGGIKDPIGMSGIRLEVDTHIISASSSIMHNITKCVNQVGLSVSDAVFGGWVAAESVLTNTEKELGVMLLDIGGGITNISIYQDEAIYYSSSVDLGGNNITSDLAIGLRLSLSDAERVKCEASILEKNAKVRIDNQKEKEKGSHKNEIMFNISDLGIEGSSVNEIPKNFFDEIIDARLEEIFVAVKDQLNSAGVNTKFPAGVVLTGGTSKLLGITEYAQKYLSNSVRLGTAQGLYGLTDEITGPAFSVIHGMISYALKYGINNKESSKIANASKNIVDRVKLWIRSFLP